MKKNINYLVLTAIITMAASPLCADADKNITSIKIDASDMVALNPKHEVRYVNAMEIIQRSDQGRKMAQDFEKKQMKAAQEFQVQREVVEREFREYSEKKVTLSEAAQRQEEQRLNRKKKGLESRAEELEQDLKVEMAQATESLYKELEVHVERMAQSEGIHAVIDTYSGRPIYVAESLNYTDSILQAWNQGFDQAQVVVQKETPKATATA